jgi:hypothetical protein
MYTTRHASEKKKKKKKKKNGQGTVTVSKSARLALAEAREAAAAAPSAMRLSCVAALVCCVFVRADLPVHCAKREVLGTWHLKRCNGTSSAAETCNHAAPDHVMTMPDAGIGWSKPGFDVAPGRDIFFSLKNPNVVRLQARRAGRSPAGSRPRSRAPLC